LLFAVEKELNSDRRRPSTLIIDPLREGLSGDESVLRLLLRVVSISLPFAVEGVDPKREPRREGVTGAKSLSAQREKLPRREDRRLCFGGGESSANKFFLLLFHFLQ
jgi:hypothetical protein